VKGRRAFVYLAAGLVCAGITALATLNRMSRATSDPEPVNVTRVLVAARAIDFGEVILTQGTPDQVNARYAAWPQRWVPDGCLRSDSDLGEVKWRAAAAMVKHQPIQKPLLVSDEEFIPADMYAERVRVPVEDISSGMIRPGMVADILKIADRTPTEFMRCVRVYALGKLDDTGRPLRAPKDPTPNVFVLIRKSDRETFLEVNQRHDLVLRAAAGVCGDSPVLVEGVTDGNQAMVEAQRQLIQAVLDVDAGRYEEAIVTLEKILSTAEYAAIPSVAKPASERLGKAREALAQRWYDGARRALDDGDVETAIGLIDRIQQECQGTKVATNVGALSDEAQSALELGRRRTQYRDLLDEIEGLLVRGDLPGAESELAGLQQFADGQFSPAPGDEDPEEALARCEQRLKDAQADYQLSSQVLDAFIRRGKLSEAEAKLEDIRGRFPDHPRNGELQRQVDEARNASAPIP
jgi:tetratricopeptide (TPR) repeat protein